LGRVLFACILFSLFPIVFAHTISPDFASSMMYQVLVGIMFILQSVIVLKYFLTSETKTIKIIFLIYALILTISQLITLLLSSLTIGINYLDIINAFARFISVFIFLCIPSKMTISKDDFRRFMLLITILGLVASLYNLVTNFREALNILNINNAYEVSFTSFYLNRNSFAQLLLFSIIANSFLNSETKRKYRLLFYLLYFINIFLTLSRTVLASVIIFLVVSSVIYKRNIIKGSIIILIAIIILALLIQTKPDIKRFIIDMVVRKETGTSGRTDLWSVGIRILDDSNWFFGVGYISSIDIINDMGFSSHEFHSFYIETLVGGGIIDLLLHLIILIFISARIKVIYKNDRKIGALYFSAYISLLVYAMFESASIFSMGYVGTLFTIFIVTIPLLYSNNFLSEPTAT